jgi:hypothetical protein
MSAMKEQLWAIVEAIDEVFGEGYAKKNPDLVGRVMQGEQTAFGAFQICEAFHRLVGAKDAEPV